MAKRRNILDHTLIAGLFSGWSFLEWTAIRWVELQRWTVIDLFAGITVNHNRRHRFGLPGTNLLTNTAYLYRAWLLRHHHDRFA